MNAHSATFRRFNRSERAELLSTAIKPFDDPEDDPVDEGDEPHTKPEKDDHDKRPGDNRGQDAD